MARKIVNTNGAGVADDRRREEMWIGGVIEDGVRTRGAKNAPRRIAVWLDPTDGAVLGERPVGDDTPAAALSTALLEAMEKPHVGPPRRPDCVRVSDRTLVDGLDDLVYGIGIDIAPTPELEDLDGEIDRASPPNGAVDEPMSAPLLGADTVGADALEHFFAATSWLYQLRPWEALGRGQPVALQAPELGYEHGCLVIAGDSETGFSVQLFESAEAFRMSAHAEECAGFGRWPAAAGALTLSIRWFPQSRLPVSTRREIERRGGPGVDEEAYPMVTLLDAQSTPIAVGPREVQLATACAQALGALVEQHGAQLADGLEKRVRLTVPMASGGRVRLEAPHPELLWEDFADVEDGARMRWSDEALDDAEPEESMEEYLEMENLRYDAMHADGEVEEEAPVPDPSSRPRL